MERSPQPVPGKETSVFHRLRTDQQLLYLRLSVTDRCNFRCQYCRPAKTTRDESLPPSASNAELVDLVRRIDRVRPLHKLRLTGGEPLLRPGLVDLVRNLRALLPNAVLALTTNGSMLSRLARPLRMAGLDALNISLDTLDPVAFATLSRGGQLGRVLEGIRAAQAEGFGKLKLNSVLIRRVNGDHLGSLVRLAVDVGCEIRFIELMPCGPGATLFATDFLSANEARTALEREFAYLDDLDGNGTARRHRFAVEGRPVTIGFITPVSHPFCATCNRLRLDCRGRLVSCLRSPHIEDLLTPLHRGDADEIAGRIRSCLAAKCSPGEAWSTRQMVWIGG